MFHQRRPETGAPPGTLVFRKESTPARVQVVRYSADNIENIPIGSVDDIAPPTNDDELLWIDVAGIDDPEVLCAGGERFGLSALTMEDIVNVPQRPKSEVLDGQVLGISHVLKIDDEGLLHIDQLSLLLGKNYVVSVHSQSAEFLDAVRRRLQNADSRLRRSGSDFLAYAIADTVVDGYFPVLETLGERLEHLEDETLDNPRPETLREIHRVRSQLIQVRRSAWPMREAFESLSLADTPVISDEVHPYLRDTHSHCQQVVDTVEMYRESAGALITTYMSSVAHRSNEIMKVLTMMSSVFVPLTFIAGIYGMNFEHMPELSYQWSYPIALGLMAITATAMCYFFLRQGWFGRHSLQGGATRVELTTDAQTDRRMISVSEEPANPQVRSTPAVEPTPPKLSIWRGDAA